MTIFLNAEVIRSFIARDIRKVNREIKQPNATTLWAIESRSRAGVILSIEISGLQNSGPP
jgi:hypothetical protein